LALDKSRIEAIQGRFRKRLANDAKIIPVGEIMPDVFESGEVWYAKVATGTESDKILAVLQDSKIFAAQCEAIYWRCYEDEELTRRCFTGATKPDIAKFDPQDVASIVDHMGGFEDIAPDQKEMEGNSSTTHGPEVS